MEMLGHSGVCVYVLVYRNGPTRIQGTLMDGNGRTRVMERGGTEFIWNISPIVPKAGREGDLKGVFPLPVPRNPAWSPVSPHLHQLPYVC